LGLAALTITGEDKNENLLGQIRDDQTIDRGRLLYELCFLRIFVVHEVLQGFIRDAAERESLIASYDMATEEFANDKESFERDKAERLQSYLQATRMTHPSGPMWLISGDLLKFIGVDENNLALRMLISIEAGATAVGVKSYLGDIRIDYGK
jgi:hypothetical protein